MKLVLLSDTHGFHTQVKVPVGDILIHTGDSTMTGETWEMKNFLRWFTEQPFRHKIFINGNHEVQVSKFSDYTRRIVDEEFRGSGTIYLENESVQVEGLKFYGSPYTPEFFPEHWAYQLKAKDAEGMWSQIPDDTDVLLTHGPVFGKMDAVKPLRQYPNENAGCPELLKKVLEIKPKLHVFGHIHGSFNYIEGVETLFVNASTCNEAYIPTNPPIVVDTETWKVIND